MRLEVVCALLAVASVTIGTSAEDSDRPWRSYVDDDGRSVRDALDSSRPWRSYVDDDGRSVRDALDSSRPWRSYVDDDGRSVRDALDSSRPWRSYVDDERSVRDAVDDEDGQSVLGNDDGRSVRDDDANNYKVCPKPNPSEQPNTDNPTVNITEREEVDVPGPPTHNSTLSSTCSTDIKRG
ncbi:hypothetical protein EMCRGX_G001587 [Ephydatia muelleri]